MENKNNIAYIDGQNLHMGTTKLEAEPWKVNLLKLRIYLKDHYGVQTCYYFLGFVNEEADKNLGSIEKMLDGIKSNKIYGFISSITVSEIFAVFSKLGEAKKAVETLVLLKEIGVIVVPVTEDIAKDSGVFKAKYSRAKKGFSYADAIILSTSLHTKSDALITYDPEFSGVSENKILRPEDCKY